MSFGFPYFALFFRSVERKTAKIKSRSRNFTFPLRGHFGKLGTEHARVRLPISDKKKKGFLDEFLINILANYI